MAMVQAAAVLQEKQSSPIIATTLQVGRPYSTRENRQLSKAHTRNSVVVSQKAFEQHHRKVSGTVKHKERQVPPCLPQGWIAMEMAPPGVQNACGDIQNRQEDTHKQIAKRKQHLTPSATSRDIFNYIRLLGALSSLSLNVSRDGAPTTSRGNLFQCFTTLIVKKFFLISTLNLPSFSLKPLPLVLSQQALLKSCNKVSTEPSLLQAEQPQLSQPFFIGEVFHPSGHLRGPPLDPLQQICVFPVLRTPELDAVLQSCSQSLHPPACIDTGGCPAAQVQDLALGLVEPHEVHMDPLLQLVQVPLDDIPSFWRVNPPLSLVSSANLLRVYLIPLSMSLMKILNSTSPNSIASRRTCSMIFPGREVRLTVGGTLFPQFLSCGPSTQEVWKEKLPVKTEAKKLSSTSAFSSSVVTSLPFSSSCALAFLTPSLHNRAVSLYSSQDTCPCFHCLCISFLPFSLTSRTANFTSARSLQPRLPPILMSPISSPVLVTNRSSIASYSVRRK
ncbi:hypothetical protein QYF61_019285 [Mycteria americana]|uniref:Uncharacterized protein n=1 Tax=Mycteria americana TaxID=33587 RepID=A0AAN7NF83_MYCAM|nr:hypothetical protein QYF61_019285 [Mycteria americana]